jgi:hypothetical protein
MSSSNGRRLVSSATTQVARRPDGRLLTHKLLSENPERYRDAAVQGIRELLGLAAGAPVPADANPPRSAPPAETPPPVVTGGGSTEVVYDPGTPSFSTGKTGSDGTPAFSQGLPSPVGGTQPASPFVRYLIAGGVGAAVGAVGAKVMKKKMTVPTLVGLGLGLAAAWFAGRGQG